MYIVRLFSCIFSANSPCWVWMLARLIECVAFCWIGRTLFENQQPHRQRWEDTDWGKCSIFSMYVRHGFWDFGKKWPDCHDFKCVCFAFVSYWRSWAQLSQLFKQGGGGEGGFFEVRFPSERPGQWHPTTSVHIQNIGLNYNCRPKAFYDHSIRIQTKGGGIFLIWEA